VLCLRGNHEQMLLDFIEGSANLWITPSPAASARLSSYTGKRLSVTREQIWMTRAAQLNSVPESISTLSRAPLLLRRRLRDLRTRRS